MADVTRTKADVRPLTGAITQRGEAGAAIEGGEAVYLDGSNGWKPCDDDTPTTCRAVCVTEDVSSGDDFDMVVFGPLVGYSGMTPGTTYYASTNPGEVAPVGDVANNVVVGWARSATVLFVNPGA